MFVGFQNCMTGLYKTLYEIPFLCLVTISVTSLIRVLCQFDGNRGKESHNIARHSLN